MATQKKSGSSGSGSSKSSAGSSKSSAGSSKSSGGSGRGSRRSGNGSGPAQASRSSSASARAQGAGGEPDVLLDVGHLKVDEIGMEVDNLHARVALEARLGDLLALNVGADIVADRVAMEIKGVEAQAQLKARLDTVLSIIDRTLKTVDENPEVIAKLIQGDASEMLEATEQGGNGAGKDSSGS